MGCREKEVEVERGDREGNEGGREKKWGDREKGQQWRIK